jgi:hypothetical protein
MKTLKQILEVYSPKSADEKRFVKKHITIKHPDAAGNGDDVFKGAKVKAVDRLKERHGYKAGDDEAVYEETESLDEAEMHRVNVVVSDPNSTSVSQRKTKMQKVVRLKANDKDNAINKATAYYQKRGFKVHDHNYIGQVNEESEQIDELSKSTLGSYAKKATNSVASNAYNAGDSNKDIDTRSKAFGKTVKRLKGVSIATDKLTKEETQLDELSKSTLGSYIKKASATAVASTKKAQQYGNLAKDSEKRAKDPKLAFAKDLNKSIGSIQAKTSVANAAKAEKRSSGVIKAVDRLAKEDHDLLADINDQLIEDMLNEVLSKNADAGDYISDFVKSDNPKFAGKSKAKRIKMALGAYYSKQRGE